MKKTNLLFLTFLFIPFLYRAQQTITLLTPYDQDTIETIYPVFSWYYIASNDNRVDESYVFTLVELSTEQSAQAGVTVNTPILQIDGVQGFQLSYPFDAPELQYNHRYGWRLQHKVNGVVTDASEAWEFTLYKEVIIPMKYAVLNTAFNATTYDVDGDGFFFKLQSRYKTGTSLNFEILNEKSEKVEIQLGEDEKLGEEEVLEKTGRDFYYLKTGTLTAGTYTLIVKDMKGNKFNTRFRIN